jgi:hypothetical protein
VKKTILLKIKLRSLADEARLIRREERKAFSRGTEASRAIGMQMVEHRKTVIRSAARNTVLAYGFLRGLQYRDIEAKAYSAPEWKDVLRMVRRYGDRYVSEQEFESWKSQPERSPQSLSPVYNAA